LCHGWKPAKPGSFRFLRQRDVDQRGRHVAENRVGIGLEGRYPLLGLLVVSPCRPVSSDVDFRRLLKGDRFQSVDSGLRLRSLAGFDRIDAIEVLGNNVLADGVSV